MGYSGNFQYLITSIAVLGCSATWDEAHYFGSPWGIESDSAVAALSDETHGAIEPAICVIYVSVTWLVAGSDISIMDSPLVRSDLSTCHTVPVPNMRSDSAMQRLNST